MLYFRWSNKSFKMWAKTKLNYKESDQYLQSMHLFSMQPSWNSWLPQREIETILRLEQNGACNLWEIYEIYKIPFKFYIF